MDKTIVSFVTGEPPLEFTVRTLASYVSPGFNGSHGPLPVDSRINSTPPDVRVFFPIAEVYNTAFPFLSSFSPNGRVVLSGNVT